MSLDLGALVGSVILETSTFDRAYARVVQQFSQLGLEAEKGAAGTTALDGGLNAVASSAAAAAAGVDKVVVSTTESSASEDKAAAAAQRHAAAIARVSEVTAADTDASTRLQAAQLRQIAAQDRLDTAMSSGTASTARLAGAQASLIAATDRAAAAEEAAAVETDGLRAAMGSTLKMAGELGLALGVFELVKKAIDITKEAAAYQSSMTRIRTLTGASQQEVDSMSKSLLALAGPVATAPDELATSLYHMESIGLHGAAALDAVRIAAEGAKIGNASLEDTTNALTSTIASGIAKNQSFTATMSDLLTIVGTGDMKLQDFNESLSSGLLAVLSKTGLSLTDVGAAIATFGDNNIRGANAATMLRVAVQAMQSPMKSGADALASIGLASNSLQKDMVKGGLNAAITDLNNHLKESGVSADNTGALLVQAFGKKANTGISVLIANYDRLQSKYAMLDQGALSFGERWDATSKTATFAFQRIGASIQAAGISLTGKLLPPLTTAAVWIGTTLPRDLSMLGSDLSGVGHVVETVFGASWTVASGAIKIAADALGWIVDGLSHVKGPLTDIGVIALSTWATFKGAQIIEGIIRSLITWITAIPTAMTGMVTKARAATASYVASMGNIGSSSKAAAADSVGSMSAIEAEAAAMAGTVEEEGAAASIGWAGLLGPIAGVAIGVGLLVSMFHKSSSASKEATAAADAYTKALQSANPGDLTISITTQLSDNNVPATVDKINKVMGFAAISSKDFVTAIQSGGQPLDELRMKLQAIITSGTTVSTTVGRGASVVATVSPAAKAATKALADLNTQYATLTKTAQKDLVDTKAFAGVSSSIDQVTASIDTSSQASMVSSKAAASYAGMLGIVVDSNGIASVSSAVLTKAVTTVGTAFNTTTATGNTFLAAMNTFSQSQGTSADRAAILGATLVAANGDALSYVGALASATAANFDLVSSFQSQATAVSQANTGVKQAQATLAKASKGTADYTTAQQALTTAQQAVTDALGQSEKAAINLTTGTIDYTKQGAAPLVQQLQAIQTAAMNAAEATYQHNLATEGGTKAADDAYNIYKNQTSGALDSEYKKLGLTSGQAKKLSDAYFGMPADVKTTIEQEGADPVLTVLNKLGTQLSYLTGRPWIATVTVDTGQAMAAIAAARSAIISLNGLKTTAGQNQVNVKEAQLSAGHNAGGTQFWRGGPTSLAEQGYELVTAPTVQNLPRGAKVYTHAQTEDWLSSMGPSGSGGSGGRAAAAPSIDGARIVIDAGSLGTLTGYIDGRADNRFEANADALHNQLTYS